MSLPTVDGIGSLLADPRRGLTGTGKKRCSALLKFASGKKVDGKWEDDIVVVIDVLALDQVAEALAERSKGDVVHVTGRIKGMSIWTPKAGEPRPQLSVFLDLVEPPPARKRESRDEPPADPDWPTAAVPNARSGDTAGNVVQFRGGDSSARLLRAHQNNPLMTRNRRNPA